MIKWFYSTNHKDIGILYFIFSFWAGILDSSIRIIICLKLDTCKSLINNDQVFNSIITSHTFLIMFFIVILFIISGFGNFLKPLMLGTSDIAYPRINNIRFWLLFLSLILLIIGSYVGIGAGTIYPPLAANTYHNKPSIDLTIFSLQIYHQL